MKFVDCWFNPSSLYPELKEKMTVRLPENLLRYPKKCEKKNPSLWTPSIKDAEMLNWFSYIYHVLVEEKAAAKSFKIREQEFIFRKFTGGRIELY